MRHPRGGVLFSFHAFLFPGFNEYGEPSILNYRSTDAIPRLRTGLQKMQRLRQSEGCGFCSDSPCLRQVNAELPRRQNEITTMKKTILLALAIGFTSALIAHAGDAKEIFDSQCAKCHGADGKGQTKMGQKLGVKDYSDPKVQAELKDDEAFKAIKEGLKKDDKTVMKAAEGLSDDDIKALVAHMRSFKQ